MQMVVCAYVKGVNENRTMQLDEIFRELSILVSTFRGWDQHFLVYIDRLGEKKMVDLHSGLSPGDCEALQWECRILCLNWLSVEGYHAQFPRYLEITNKIP
jgi:hypothetical protein